MHYRRWAADDAQYADYLARCIHGTADHEELLEMTGPARLDKLRADARTGYAVNLDRR